MIDAVRFLDARHEGLFGKEGLAREAPTDEFLDLFLENHGTWDGEHVRCALTILSSMDSEALRGIAKSYHDHPDAHARFGSGLFFARQVDRGFIEPMTFQDWITKG